MKTILVLDDEPAVLYLLTLYLRGSYHVLEAADTAEAVRIATRFEGDIHVAIIDHGMRDRGEVDIARVIMESRPETPVLLISGDREDQVAAQSGTHGRRLAFLQKPFLPGELVAKVEELLRGEQASNAPA